MAKDMIKIPPEKKSQIPRLSSKMSNSRLSKQGQVVSMYATFTIVNT